MAVNAGPSFGQFQNQSQQLVMTAMLQQAIKLLPLSRQELILTMRQEMVDNPFLEDGQPEEEGYDVVPEWENGNMDLTASSSESGRGEPEIDLTAYFDSHLDMGYHEGDPPESPSVENRLRKDTTLAEHLLWQLSLCDVSEDLKPTAVEIIGNLTDDGYFRVAPEEFVGEANCRAQQIEEALAIIQGFDPPGVAARSLKECLFLQVGALGIVCDLIHELLENHLDQLEDRFLPKVARLVGADVTDVLEAARLIRSLNPRPGHRFHETPPAYVDPDVYVYKTGNEPGEEYQIFLNEDGMPRLRINAAYRALLRNENPGETKQYLEDRLRTALWFLKSIEQRRQTLMKVSRSIVRFQRDFLEQGVQALRPLVLRDVAMDIGMHESTVSRVATGKYMHTPQGIHELKFFFHSELKSGFGEGTSSVSVKDQIRRLVDDEDPHKPLTDQMVVDRLKARNVEVARRTVAKYRKELKIPPASRRKRVVL